MPSQAEVATLYSSLVLQTSQFKSALTDATSETRKFSSEMRAQSREAQASIALLGEEIGVRLPRHLRSFVSQLPGVSAAMSAAFNAVAVFALIDLVVKAGEKVTEFVNKNREEAEKLREAYEEFGISGAQAAQALQEKLLHSQKALDDLRDNHVKALHDEIELLNLQGLDELSKTFENLAKNVDNVFKQIKVSWADNVGSLLVNGAFNAGASGQSAELSRVQNEYNRRLYAQGPNGEVIDPEKRRQDAESYLQSQYGRNRDIYNVMNEYLSLHGNQPTSADMYAMPGSPGAARNARVNVLAGQLRGYGVTPSEVNPTTVGAQGTLASVLQQAIGEAGTLDSTLHNGIQAAGIKAGNDALSNQMKQLNLGAANLTGASLVSYWENAGKNLHGSGESYNSDEQEIANKLVKAVQDQFKSTQLSATGAPTAQSVHQNPQSLEMWNLSEPDRMQTYLTGFLKNNSALVTPQMVLALQRVLADLTQKISENTLSQAAKQGRQDQESQKEAARQLQEAAVQMLAAAKALEKLQETNQKIQEASFKMLQKYNLETGSISPHQAAQQNLDSIKSSWDNDIYPALMDERNSIDALAKNDTERKTLEAGWQEKFNQAQAKNIQGEFQAQIELYRTTTSGGIRSVFDDIIVESRDLSTQFHDVFKGMFDGINSELANFVTGQKTSWARMFQSLEASLVKKGLTNLEGTVFKHMHLGTAGRDTISNPNAKTDLDWLAGGNLGLGSSPSRPLYVRDVGSLPGGVGSTGASVGGDLSGLFTSSANTDLNSLLKAHAVAAFDNLTWPTCAHLIWPTLS